MADTLIKLVKTYRLVRDLSQRLLLAEQIFREVEPKLRIYVYGKVRPVHADDVLQNVLRSVAGSLASFKGATNAEFWGWSYRIARNRIADHFARCASDRLIPMSTEDLASLMEASAQLSPMSRGERADLDYAMQLLGRLKAECQTLLWSHYVLGLTYEELAEEVEIAYDAVRMRINRCLETARAALA